MRFVKAQRGGSKFAVCPHPNCGSPLTKTPRCGYAHQCSRGHYYTACSTCGDPIARQEHEVYPPERKLWKNKRKRSLHAQQCNGCWAVTSRLDWFLDSAGGVAVVMAALRRALKEKDV